MSQEAGDVSSTITPHAEAPENEHTRSSVANRLNRLRAGVLGANDGIISTAGLVIGVASASTSADHIATAGIAGLVAGAVSMALGEYVSVSTQRDTETALIKPAPGSPRLFPVAHHCSVPVTVMLRARGSCFVA